MKLAVVIPAHCHPDILRLTLGSLLQNSWCHDLDIHIGFHFNYSDYCSDIAIFDELQGVANLHFVEEIDWQLRHDDIARYSYMHARQIEFLFRQIRYHDFDYILLLDNDVFVKQDFVSALDLLTSQPDLIGTLFDDLDRGREGVQPDGARVHYLPKISPWHVLISRRLYMKIIEDFSVLYPQVTTADTRPDLQRIYNVTTNNIFVDTLAEVLHRCRFMWEMRIQTVPTAVFESWAHHFFFSSFNYGQITGQSREAEIRETYTREFPYGISTLLASWRAGACVRALGMPVMPIVDNSIQIYDSTKYGR